MLCVGVGLQEEEEDVGGWVLCCGEKRKNKRGKNEKLTMVGVAFFSFFLT